MLVPVQDLLISYLGSPLVQVVLLRQRPGAPAKEGEVRWILDDGLLVRLLILRVAHVGWLRTPFGLGGELPGEDSSVAGDGVQQR